jgi:hypothetical protein
MGRSIFEEVWKEAIGNGFENKFRKLYLYGPSGVGKSHLLAALVFSLVRHGERVVYIADCQAAASDPLNTLRTALLFAFHDVEDLQGALADAGNLGDITNVIHTQHSRSFYLIVNSLDFDVCKKDPDAQDLYTALKRIGSCQKYIFSASANLESDQVADKKQTETKVIRLNAGMTQVCPHSFSNYLVLYSLA